MKIKLAVVLTVAMAFVAGYFLGCNQTKESMSQSWRRSYLLRHRGDCFQELQRTILILTQFREGNLINGVAMLERCLDGSLMVAAGCDAELKENIIWIPGYVQIANDYRTKYPWTNPVPELDVKVRKILSAAK